MIQPRELVTARGVCNQLFTKGMGFLSPRDDHGVKRFTFTASWCSKQGRLSIALYPETFIEEEREIVVVE